MIKFLFSVPAEAEHECRQDSGPLAATGRKWGMGSGWRRGGVFNDSMGSWVSANSPLLRVWGPPVCEGERKRIRQRGGFSHLHLLQSADDGVPLSVWACRLMSSLVAAAALFALNFPSSLYFIDELMMLQLLFGFVPHFKSVTLLIVL